MSFLRLESKPANAMILSAVKMAEDGSGLTVRLYNSVSVPVRFTLGCGFPASAVASLMLSEKKIADLSISDAGGIEYTAAPKEIVTVKFVF